MKIFVKMGAAVFSLTLIYFRVSGDGISLWSICSIGTSNCLSGNTFRETGTDIVAWLPCWTGVDQSQFFSLCTL